MVCDPSATNQHCATPSTQRPLARGGARAFLEMPRAAAEWSPSASQSSHLPDCLDKRELRKGSGQLLAVSRAEEACF